MRTRRQLERPRREAHQPVEEHLSVARDAILSVARDGIDDAMELCAQGQARIDRHIIDTIFLTLICYM